MMRIESDMTGSVNGENLFSFADRAGDGGDGRGIVSYYNMNNVASSPCNASFEWNGETKEALGNTFVMGRSLEVSLYRPGEQGTQISYVPDSDKILGGIRELMKFYNKLVNSTDKYCTETGQNTRLVKEYRNLLRPYASELESSGISFDENGYMKLDEALATQSALDGDMEKLLGSGSVLNQKLQKKNDQIKLNPMDYVEKKIVSYLDYGKPPKGYSYITSLYSGMLFNYYC